MNELDFTTYRNIILLTGAGVSAPSGLPTFRGMTGLPAQTFMHISDARNLPGTLPEVWRVYGGLRGLSGTVQPNAAHYAIANFQKRLPAGANFTLITQNVDDLHQRAGSTDVVELHGSLFRSRCTNESCSSQPFADETVYDSVPSCPACGAPLRPDIVLFHESLPLDAGTRAKQALRNCDLFIAIGTSGSVTPAADFARGAAYVGARTILLNLEPMSPANPHFNEEYLGDAAELVPRFLG